MARLTDLAHGKLDAPKLDPRDIIIRKGFNFRDTKSEASQAHIAWLKSSIRDNGVQEPIRVEFIDGKPYLVNGECRLIALRQLWNEGLEVYVPAIQIKGDEAEILAKSMIANGALPPTKLEFGAAATRLQAYGWDKSRIAQFTPPHIAKSASRAKRYVEEAIELHNAPLDVKAAVRDGVDGVKVSEGLALAATRQSRMHAGEIVKQEAEKAKAAGKKEAKRPKGPGKITKAKEAVAKKTRSLEKIGDLMAEEIVSTPVDMKRLGKLAQEWFEARR